VADARIVTDSAAELCPEVVEELGIVVVPLAIRTGTETLVDEPALRSSEFHRRIARENLVTTAIPPTVSQFAAAYAALSGEASGVVSIHLSSQLNGAAQAAREARGRFLGRCPVTVIDSQAISRAQGILVTEAARAARDGVTAPEIVRLVRGMIPRTYFAFYTQSLEFVRAGRIPQASGDAAANPLLTMEGGEIVRVHRLRGRGTVLERLFEFVAEFQELETLSILHSGLMPEADELRERLADLLPGQAMEEHIYGPVLGAYIGPAALGIVAFEG